MSIEEYLSKDPNRKKLLSAIHEIILKADKKATARIGNMMGKPMIMYETSGIFKYGLGSPKNYITLHLMPMYASKTIHSKYEELLSKAKFQKGCINFTTEEQISLPIVKELLKDCAEIDMIALMEKYKSAKKKSSPKSKV